MKFSSISLVALVLASVNHVGHASEEACVAGGFEIQFDGECSLANALEEYKDSQFSSVDCSHSVEEDFNLIIGLAKNATTADAESAVREVCKTAWENTHVVEYEDIAREYGQFEQTYYNGGTYWNEEVETNRENEDGSKSNHLRHDARYVRQFYESKAQTAQVEWPDYLTNFDPSTCEINAAYCCWPQDRQANDGNGNCATPYDTNCIDKDPADNTDLCYIDLTRSPKSNSFGTEGSMMFPNDNNDGEGAIHCHGFAWANDEYDVISRYKANNLFYVSMYDHMHQRGYVRNIQGSPMCACAEQMPSVSRSDCTQTDVDETYKFTYNPVNSTMTAELTAVEIDFNSCRGKFNKNNDLWYYFLRLQDEGKVTPDQKHALNKYLVGDYNCKMAQDYQMNQMEYIPGYKHDESSWTRVAGRDILDENPLGPDLFKASFEKSPNKIIHRVCASCVESHQHIYYKRLTDVPATTDLLHILLNSWQSTTTNGNLWKTDFQLYSSYDDALEANDAWTYCSFHGSYGFPFECGPTGRVRYQWSRFHWRSGREDVAFYVEGPAKYTTLNGVDIGTLYVPGSARKLDENIYLTASGWDIWSREDHFYYLSEPKSGEATLQVFVSKHNKVNVWGKAGLMMRQTQDKNSANVFCMLSGNYGVYMTSRFTAGDYTRAYRNTDSVAHTSVWLRLEKRANTFTCKKSTDGSTWATVYQITLGSWDSSKFESGLALTSHDYYRASEAVFENYENEDFFSPSAAPTVSSAPSHILGDDNSVDIGDVRTAGSATVGGNVITLTAYGYDIWSRSDSFHYIYYAGTGDMTAVVKVDLLVAARTWTKAGLMFRESLDANSKYMDLVLTGGAGVVTQYRSSTNGYATHYSPNSGGDKDSAWLKLEKTGNSFQSYRSVDGEEWIKMGNAITLSMSTNYYVGMALVGSQRNRGVARFTDYKTY